MDSLPLGAALPYLTLAQIVLNADPNIVSISSLTVNGGKSDIAGAPGQSIRVSSVSVS